MSNLIVNVMKFVIQFNFNSIQFIVIKTEYFTTEYSYKTYQLLIKCSWQKGLDAYGGVCIP